MPETDKIQLHIPEMLLTPPLATLQWITKSTVMNIVMTAVMLRDNENYCNDCIDILGSTYSLFRLYRHELWHT